MASPKTSFMMEDLIGKIFQQRFPGDKLPSERALAAAYNVSRATAQKAIRRLIEMGLLQSRPGGGVYVRKGARGNPLVYNSVTQVPYRDLSSRVLYLKRITATDKLARVFLLEPGAELWEFCRVRIVNYEKTQIETGYMPYALFPRLGREALEDSLQNYAMDLEYRISHFMTNYRPAALTRQEAELLNCRRSTPAFAITSRGFLRGGTVFVYSRIKAIHYECTYIVPFNKEVYLSRRKR